MATHKQGTTEKLPANQGSTLIGPKGSDPAHLKQSFPAAVSGPYKIPTPEEVVAMGKVMLQDGYVNDGGHTFGDSHNRDYQHPDNPDLDDFKNTGPGGLPSTAYTPNTVSPGPGSTNPADMPVGPEPAKPGGSPWPRGDGLASPKKTSADTAAQTLGDLMFGKSSPNSKAG